MTDDAKPLGVVNASQPRKTRQRLKKGSHIPKVNSHDTSTLPATLLCLPATAHH